MQIEISMIVNKYRLVSLADSTSACFDTSFYSAHWLKKNKFISQHLENGSIGAFISENELPGCLLDCFSEAKEIGVKDMWNDKSKPFFRFDFAESPTYRPVVLILRESVDSLQINFDSLRDKGFLKFSYRVLLKLPK